MKNKTSKQKKTKTKQKLCHVFGVVTRVWCCDTCLVLCDLVLFTIKQHAKPVKCLPFSRQQNSYVLIKFPS